MLHNWDSEIFFIEFTSFSFLIKGENVESNYFYRKRMSFWTRNGNVTYAKSRPKAIKISVTDVCIRTSMIAKQTNIE